MKYISFSHSRSSSFLMTSASNHVLVTCTADTWTLVPRNRIRLEMQPIFCSLIKVLMDASVTHHECQFSALDRNSETVVDALLLSHCEGRNMLSKNDIALNTRRTQNGEMLMEMQFKIKTLLLNNYLAFLFKQY